jgi:hypothetical protein
VSHIQPGSPCQIDNWEDVADWLGQSFDALETADVFEVGPRDARPQDTNNHIPCAQAMALDGGILLRLSTALMETPLLRSHSVDKVTLDVWRRGRTFGDCTFGFVVSADLEFLASACVNWFRDKHQLHHTELGCELTEAVSLQGPRGIPPSERY